MKYWTAKAESSAENAFFASAKYCLFVLLWNSIWQNDKQWEGLVLIPSCSPIAIFKLGLLIALLMERGRQLMLMMTKASVVVVYICSGPFVGQYNGQSRQTYAVGQTHWPEWGGRGTGHHIIISASIKKVSPSCQGCWFVLYSRLCNQNENQGSCCILQQQRIHDRAAWKK